MQYFKKLRRIFSIILCLTLLIAVADAQNQALTEDLKLESGRGGVDGYATGLSVDGDTAVIGDWLDDEVDFGAGAAYIYERNESGTNQWGQIAKLTANDGLMNNRFGIAVAIDGNTIVVGAPYDFVNGIAFAGSAYIFERNDTNPKAWSQVAKLVADDGTEDAYFGEQVDINGDTIIIGAQGHNSDAGAAYVFQRNRDGPNQWGQVKKLASADLDDNDRFGVAVAVDGDRVIVGAIFADTPGGAGAAYIFERDAGGTDNWGQTAKLVEPDGRVDHFGEAVDIEGDRIIVSAPDDSNDSGARAGTVYLFERHIGVIDSWGLVTELIGANAGVASNFGEVISLHNEWVIVGARLHDTPSDNNNGAAYLFYQDTGGVNNWGQVAKLQPSDSGRADFFGQSVSISHDVVLVGASSEQFTSNQPSGAYLYNLILAE